MEDPAAVAATSSSIWASLNSLFTNSTLFFLLLNLMIATIVFTSNLPDNNNNNNPQQQHDQQEQEQQDPNKNTHSNHNQPQITRSPSLLHRLKSFNFNPQKTHQDSSNETHYNQHPLEVAATQYVFNQPLEYQHFDFDPTNPDQTQDINTRVENVTVDYHFNGRDDFDPAREDSGFGFDPTREEVRGNGVFDFDPNREDSGFGFDPTREEVRRNGVFDSDPTREETRFDLDPSQPGIGNSNGSGSGFDGSDEEQFESLDEVYSKLKGGGHDRTKSDGSIPTKPAAKMKKSASLKVGFAHLEEEEIVEARRPATVKERKTAVKVVDDDDVEVDSKADDFINKFKNDLKLQRIESIMRTKGGMKRGGGK